jgi:hypothetical protein
MSLNKIMGGYIAVRDLISRDIAGLKYISIIHSLKYLFNYILHLY